MTDIDLDGDLDIFISNFRGGLWETEQYSRIYINDGTGHFVESSSVMLPVDYEYPVNEVCIVDLNNDIFPDIILANYSTTEGSDPFDIVQVYINNSGNNFIDSTDNYIIPNSEYGEMNLAVDAGDIDGDGSVDVIIGTDGQTRLYFNHIQQTAILNDEINTNSPNSFALYQNYPNPFNPFTTIKYHLPY